MKLTKKRMVIVFVCVFFFALNIYNIPTHSTAVSDETVQTNRTDTSSVLIHSLKSAVELAGFPVVNPNDYHTIIVDFWATWCPSCRLQNDVFNQYLTTDPGILIIGVCVDNDPNALNTYASMNPMDFVSVNNTAAIAALFDDISAVPTHYIIDVSTQRMTKQLGVISLDSLAELSKKHDD